MKELVKDIFIICLISLLVSLAFNFLAPQPLPLLSGQKIIEENMIRVFKEFTIEEVDIFSKENDFLLIDARSDDLYRLGHIPKALNLYVHEFDKYYPDLEAKIKQAKFLIIYCSSESCKDSQLLAEKLTARGVSAVYIYKGGFKEWQENGKPIEKGTN